MKNKKHFLRLPLLFMGVFLLFASSCEKDDDGNNNASNTFTDPRDGKVYKTVTIGNQVWMTENLKYLPSVVGPATGSLTTPYYYVYGYDGTSVDEGKAAANYATYGVLYNWPAAMAGSASSSANPSGVQGISPAGWHLPSDAEWTELMNYLGGESISGGKLKEAGTTHWNSPNKDATNETGFTALSGGLCDCFYGSFSNIGDYSNWWSATDVDIINVWKWNLSYDSSGIDRYDMSKDCGFYVRCVKD